MGVNTPKNNRLSVIAADQALIDGLNKHASTVPTVGINGAFVPAKDIVATLQSRVDSARNAQTARATWLSAVKADTDLRDKTKTTVSGLKAAMLVLFAGQIDVLGDFGLSPRKPRVVTPEVQVAAAAKAKATRAARHTMGKKQKAVIHGTVPATISVPTGSASAPTTPTPPPVPPATTTPVIPASKTVA